MIWTPENSDGYMLVDCHGEQVKMAFYFNDETYEARLYSLDEDGNIECTPWETDSDGKRSRSIKWTTQILPDAKMVKKCVD